MRACVVALLLLMAPAVHAAGMECAKPATLLSQAICVDKQLSTADATLSKLYRTDLAQLSSSSVGFLRADQVQWLAWIQVLCHVTSGDTPQDETINCLQQLYGERIKALRKAVLRRDGLSFLTRTQYLVTPDTEKAPTETPYPGFGTLQASWPIADSTEEDWVAWNHAIETRMLRLASRSNNQKPPTEWIDELAAGGDYDVHAHLKSVEHDRVTADALLGAMEHGGAHPWEIGETLTYLLTEHRALRADDVFRPDSDWKQALAAACWQQMSTGDKKTYVYEPIKGPDAPAIQQVVLTVNNWTLEPGGLHISYPEYSVSPRLATMDDAVIPWDSLKPILSPRFALP